jgi:hypothetical protein
MAGAAAAALVMVAAPGKARACSACSCGDPTLTLMGTDRPPPSSWRFSLESRSFEHTSGGEFQEQVTQSRLTVGAAWTPIRWLTATVFLPFGYLHLQQAPLASVTTVGLADSEIGARVYLWQDRHWAPQHLLSLLAGVKAPTGQSSEDQDGRAVSSDAQLGTGSWDPMVGLSYRMQRGTFMLFSSAILQWPTEGRYGLRAGKTLRATVGPQLGLGDWLAGLLTVDARVGAADVVSGETLPDTGGTIVYLSPTLLMRAHADVTLRLTVQIPVVNRLYGQHTDSLAGILGLSYAP